MQCPSCGARVSDRAASCAICGQVLSVEAAVAGARGGVRAVASAWQPALPPEPGPHRCAACDSRLEPGATFCSECGTAVITSEYAIPEFPEPVEVAPAAAPYVPTVEEPVEIPPDLATTIPPEPEPEPEIETGEYYVEDVVVPEPIPVAHDPAVYVRPAPAPARPDDMWSWAPPAAAAFAVFALLVALLVHLAAPSSLAGYSAAELSLKIQMRAVEWLLAAGVIGIVGLLLKR